MHGDLYAKRRRAQPIQTTEVASDAVGSEWHDQYPTLTIAAENSIVVAFGTRCGDWRYMMNVAECVVRNEIVPLPRYEGLWESIVVDRSMKDRLLRAALLSMELRAELPFHVTALHGLAVLIGPPGTGKSTLARGLAHQIAAAAATKRARLIEVNPHGLMSAGHGQSQQRVTKLLTDTVPKLAEDGLPTIVLLDEVESMAVARSAASLSANPADVHRATDAVLTALDENASRFPHLFTVATTNFILSGVEWMETNPHEHARIVTEKNSACQDNFVPLVKMLKAINREAGEPLKPSFLIEAMALDLVEPDLARYQDEIRFFLASAADQITDSWPDPAKLGGDVNAAMRLSERIDLLGTIRAWLATAEEAILLESEGQERAAIELWRSLFGSRMPRS